MKAPSPTSYGVRVWKTPSSPKQTKINILVKILWKNNHFFFFFFFSLFVFLPFFWGGGKLSKQVFLSLRLSHPPTPSSSLHEWNVRPKLAPVVYRKLFADRFTRCKDPLESFPQGWLPPAPKAIDANTDLFHVGHLGVPLASKSGRQRPAKQAQSGIVQKANTNQDRVVCWARQISIRSPDDRVIVIEDNRRSGKKSITLLKH